MMRSKLSLVIIPFVIGCESVNVNVSTPTTPDQSSEPTPSIASVGADIQPALAPVTVDPSPTPSASPSPSSTPTIALRFYSLTKQLASTTGGGSVPAGSISGTGSCVVYLSKTYCWDDGIKTLTGMNVHMSFWGIDDTIHACISNCSSDVMDEPIRITSSITTQLGVAATYGTAYAQRNVNNVLTTGAGTDVLCTETNGLLNCVNFTIDLNQVDR